MSKARELASLGNAYSDGALSNRNVLINGSFTVSQRGDYTTATAYTNGNYLLDRWYLWVSGVTATLQHTTVTVEGIQKRAVRLTATSSGTGYFGLRQLIELQNIQIGQTYTASCLVRSNNSNTRFRQNYFSGVSANSTVFTNDGNWERVSFTFETTGTTQNPSIGVLPYDTTSVAITSGDYVEVADFQLEVGDTATPFEHRSYGQELALAQRFFYKTPNISYDYPAFHYSTLAITGIPLPVTMRASPTVVDTTTSAYYEQGTSYSYTPSTPTGYQHMVGLRGTVGGGTSGYAGTFYPTFTADAEL